MRKLFVLIASVIALSSFAQDPSFSQFYLNKVYMNPAYAGINRDLNLNMNSRLQWSGTPSRFRTHTASIDMGCPSSRLAMGLIVFDDMEGEGFIRTAKMSGILATHIPLDHFTVASLGLEYGVGSKTIEWERLVFSDQLDPIYGAIYESTARPAVTESNMVFDLSWGAVLRHRWEGTSSFSSLGGAVHHANKPHESLLGIDTRLASRLTLHSYHHFRVSSPFTQGMKHYISGGFAYEKQQDLETLNMGFSLSFGDNVLTGVWYRNQNYKVFDRRKDAIILNTMVLLGNFTLGYSYDMTISELEVSNTHGSHEIAINYTFKGIFVCKGSGKQKRKVSSCYLFDPSHGISSGKGKRGSSGTTPFMFILP